MKIIGGATSRAMRAHWAAHELEIDYEPVLIGSRTGATQEAGFLALNTKGKIPVLVHDNLVLTESGAIINYLGRHAGGLLPTDPIGLAKYDEWQSYILMELDAQCLYVMRKHGDLANIYGDAPGAMEAARAGFNTQIRWAIEQLGDQPCLLGEEFSGVDILLTTTLAWAESYGFTLDAALQDYLRRMQQRPAYKSAGRLNFSISAGA